MEAENNRLAHLKFSYVGWIGKLRVLNDLSLSHCSFVSVCVAYTCSVVALLVKKGVCDNIDKARYASKYIEPKGIVKFIIVDGYERFSVNGYEHFAEDEDDEYGDDINMSTSYMHDSMFTFPMPTQEYYSDSGEGIDMTTEVSPPGNSMNLKGWNKRKHHHHGSSNDIDDDDPIDVTLMYVTYGTAYDLLEIIMKERDRITL